MTPERIFADRLPPPPQRGLERKWRFPLTMLSELSLTNIGPILGGYGTDTEKLRLHAIAWAIERHRLAHGHVPATLAELMPAYLTTVPTGLFDGQALRYEALSPTSYRLYALGKNARDDGGKDDDIALTFGEGP
jgi:hypothetical protein